MATAKLTNSSEKVKFKIGAKKPEDSLETEASDLSVIPHIAGLPEFNDVPTEIEVTALDDDFVKKIGGLKDYGSLEFEFFWYEGESHYDSLVALVGKECRVEITNSLGYGRKFYAVPYVKELAQASGEAAKFGVTLMLQSDMVHVIPSKQ